MELRKDPITRSWVVVGDDAPPVPQDEKSCRYCPGAISTAHTVSMTPGAYGAWSARAVVHPSPMYHIEGEPGRRGDGLYDRMQSVGAHELLVENPRHDRQLWNASDDEIGAFLLLAAQRILDLKRDRRFKYVSVYKDVGAVAGQEFQHPTSQLIATTFVPRRVLHELRASKEYFERKERCVFCDILAQEELQGKRIVEMRGDYVTLCPYAPRVAYETWLMPRVHEASFERFASGKVAGVKDLAGLLRRTLMRIRTLTEDFHLVLHTSPNSMRNEVLGYWKTIDEDYHWHIEIMPVVGEKARSYTAKEIYVTPVSSETAAARLREAKIDL